MKHTKSLWNYFNSVPRDAVGLVRRSGATETGRTHVISIQAAKNHTAKYNEPVAYLLTIQTKAEDATIEQRL